MTPLHRRWIGPLIVAALCTATLAGCSAQPASNPQQNSGSPTSQAQAHTPAQSSSSASAAPGASEHTQDVFSLAVGDCVDGTSVGAVTDVPTVACAAPHDLEVFYDFDLTGGAYPGDSVVSDAAKAGCEAQFDSFVGLTYADSALDFTEYTPTADSWRSGDRTVSCVIGDPNGKTTGTLRGAAR